MAAIIMMLGRGRSGVGMSDIENPDGETTEQVEEEEEEGTQQLEDLLKAIRAARLIQRAFIRRQVCVCVFVSCIYLCMYVCMHVCM